MGNADWSDGARADRLPVTPSFHGEPQRVYLVLRKELSGGALLSQACHAGRDSVKKCAFPTNDERAIILESTKAQMSELIDKLVAADHPHVVSTETDGPLAGSITFCIFTVAQKDQAQPFVGQLKAFRI